MYYIKTVNDKIRLPPEMFGSKVEDALLHILRDRFERRMFKEIGLILSVDNPKVLGNGIVIPGDSGAYYGVQFDALTFLPQVNEVYECEIKEIVEFGGFAVIGPLQGLLHVSQISKEKFFYDKKAKTLGSKAEKRSIKKGDTAIIKVSTVSLKGSTTETKIGLTMRPDGLGKHEWLDEKAKKVAKAEPKVEVKVEKKADVKAEKKPKEKKEDKK
ncbi:MAG: DNA-directed RNA polymerase [Candidatus Micrarchaeota archaeon]|nr:DNA-directed RNA polymerase [Candidatus Micrarchaeota archaeon]